MASVITTQLPDAFTNLLGHFPGDDARLALVQNILQHQGIYLQNKNKLINDLLSLPYKVRIGLMSILASKNETSAISKLVEDILGDDASADAMETDSEDEEMVVVFGGKRKKVSYDEKQLAIQAAVVSKQTKTMIAELDSTSLLMKKLVVNKVCKSKRGGRKDQEHLISDEELLVRICKGPGFQPLIRKKLIQRCIAERRTSVVDAALKQMHKDEEPISHFLSGASSETVTRLLPACMTSTGAKDLRWASLWRFHTPAILKLIENELSGSNMDRKKQVWNKWSPMLKHPAMKDHETVMNLLFSHPPCTWKEDKVHFNLGKLLNIKQECASFYTISFPNFCGTAFIKQLTPVQVINFIRLCNQHGAPFNKENVMGLFYKYLKQLPLKTVRKNFVHIEALLKENLFSYTPLIAFDSTKSIPVLDLVKDYVSRSARSFEPSTKGDSLDQNQMMTIIEHVKAFAGQFLPLLDLFGISGTNASSCALLPVIVPYQSILSKIKHWMQFLTPLIKNTLKCLRWKCAMRTKKKQPIDDLVNTMRKIVAVATWQESTVSDTKHLGDIWTQLKNFFSEETTRILDILVLSTGISKEMPGDLEDFVAEIIVKKVKAAKRTTDLHFLHQDCYESETSKKFRENVVVIVLSQVQQILATAPGFFTQAVSLLKPLFFWDITPEARVPVFEYMKAIMLKGKSELYDVSSTEFVTLMKKLPKSARDAEKDCIVKQCLKMRIRYSCVPSYISLSYHRDHQVPGDIKALVIRTLRSRSDVPLHQKAELLRYAPMIDIGARVGLEAECKTKVATERISAMTKLIETTFRDYNPNWASTMDCDEYRADSAVYVRDGILRTLKFINPKLANEQLQHRVTLLERIISSDVDCVTKAYLPPKTDLDLLAKEISGPHREQWETMFSNTLSSIAGSVESQAVRNCRKTLKGIAMKFTNAAVQWNSKHDTENFAARRALLNLGLTLQWKVDSQSRSENVLINSFMPSISSITHKEFSSTIIEVFLDELCNFLGGRETLRNIDTSNIGRLKKLISICKSRYTEVPTLLETIKHIVTSGPCESEDIADLVEHITSLYSSPLAYEYLSRAPPAYKEDPVVTAYYQRCVASPNISASTRRGVVDTLAGLRLVKEERIVGKTRTLKRMHRSAVQKQNSEFVSELMKLCPDSAIKNSQVLDHLVQWRDDLIEERHMASDKPPMGLFYDDEDLEDLHELTDAQKKYRWDSKDLTKTEFIRIPSKKTTFLHKCLLEDAICATMPVRERTQAAASAIALPSCSLSDVRPFFEGEKAKDIPVSVSMALLQGIIRCDDRTEPLRYLLSPARIELVESLGVRPMHIVSAAARTLPVASTLSLVKAFLDDDARTKAIGISGQKQLIRLLYSLGTKEAHTLLLECWGWQTLRHQDVRIEILHNVLSMLDEKKQPVPLVDENLIWTLLDSVVDDPNLSAEIKAVLLIPKPAVNYRRSEKSISTPRVMSKIVEKNDTLGYIEFRSPTNCKKFANVVMRLTESIDMSQLKTKMDEITAKEVAIEINLEDPSAAMDVDKSETKSSASKSIEKERRQIAKLLAYADLRALLLAKLWHFVSLDKNPNNVDDKIEQCLAKEVCSFDVMDISLNSNSRDRTKYLAELLPWMLVSISAHQLFGQYSEEKDAVVDVSQIRIAGIIDGLLAKITNFSESPEIRMAASYRLSSISEALQSNNIVMYANHWVPKLGSDAEKKTMDFSYSTKTKLCKFVGSKLLFERCYEQLSFLEVERKILKKMVNIPKERPPKRQRLEDDHITNILET
eukprot:m.35540 g.35540  ORF g.35540 m.35540 type:complete len:1776 (-) comp8890_c0_seq1:68-5395(-)